MVVTFTWGIIVISIEDGEWSLLAVVPVFLILCLVWAVYGGVAWW